MAVNIKITFRPKSGPDQILWGQLDDRDKLRDLQELTGRLDADRFAISVDASLQPGGRVSHREFRAGRLTIEEAA